MIKILDKSQCCGCEACRNICPRQCILMKEDNEGFLYPEVNLADCIDCGLCEKVCPVLHPVKERIPVSVYAAKHCDENIRLSSSSGGVFTFIAEKVIDEGGVVFGARFNEQWGVIHDYVETKEKLSCLRGSKYVQSRIGDTYKQALHFLQSGRKVLFTGTSCQIAGLKLFLRKEYDNLLTADVICHGVPSPKVWEKYLNEIISTDCLPVTDVSFRNKQNGWKNFSLKVDMKGKRLYLRSFKSDLYFDLFLSNMILRPSCYSCPAKSGKSCSDITLGDFWGIENILPKFDDDKGCSVVLLYNPKSKYFIEGMDVSDVAYSQAMKGNSSLEISANCPVNRNYFFKLLERNRNLVDMHRLCFDASLIQRIRRFVFRKYGV
ncbi:Coenzyme F420 hydrogenase/dehydrogenase, beta subunit C-terminal domain [uncultured Phocaeicola sp.]|uniref:Coenzyme F420 hydrogenase/dehydrogenase, beta subunit C-terminal domain n=1 Tax=uncultured Phocaeicola sp. TaxID=990718 RepID=UPI0025EC965F|nr:Coenzyme F420 hydrogenase/dehydrogenase, beta subunit C-terminal domain [uncultured Phocaeicola sp.]